MIIKIDFNEAHGLFYALILQDSSNMMVVAPTVEEALSLALSIAELEVEVA